MSTLKPRYYAFDFDGVICDSTDECLVTSSNAWSQLNNDGKFRTLLSEFSTEEIQYFTSVRSRVIQAGEFFVIHQARKEGIEITIKNAMKC